MGELVASIRAHRRRDGRATALVHRDERVTYAQLWRMAHDAGRWLDGSGIPPGARVAMIAHETPAAIAVLIACLASRRPVLVPPAGLAEPVLSDLLERAQARTLIDPQALEGFACGPTAKEPLPAAFAPDSPALLLTTSGSTGAPKIAELEHGALTRFARWAGRRFEIGPGTPVLAYARLSFDLSLLEVWATFAAGGCSVLADHTAASQGHWTLDAIDEHHIEVVQALPALYGLMLDAATPGRTLDSVRHAILTGDFAPSRCHERLPDLLPASRLLNVYGCTETNDSFLNVVEAASSPRDIGRPLPGVHAHVVADGTVLDGPGEGELWVSTPFQARGYVAPGGADAERFARDPSGRTGRTFFRSGDLVSRDAAGALQLRGRGDREVKIRGVRVDLAAVERTLAEVPEVDEAAVLAVEDPHAGRKLHAVVRPRPGSRLSTLALRSHCAERLLATAIPPTFEIVDRVLPKTGTGKLDRRAITRRLEGG